MTINIDTSSGINQIKIEGGLTIDDVGGYHETLKQVFLGNKNVEFDLSRVDEIDTSGLQLLAAYGKRSIDNGAMISVASASEGMKQALDISGLLVSLNCITNR